MSTRPIVLDENYDDSSGDENPPPLVPPEFEFELKATPTRVGYDAPSDGVQPVTTPDITEKKAGPLRYATRQEVFNGEARGLLIPFAEIGAWVREESDAIMYRMRQRARARRRKQAPLVNMTIPDEEEPLTDSEDDEFYLWQLPDYTCPFASSAMHMHSSGAVRPKIRRVQSAPACIYDGGGDDEDEDSSVYEILEHASDCDQVHLQFTWSGDHLTCGEAASPPDGGGVTAGNGVAAGISESIWERTRWSLRDVYELPDTQVLDLNNKYLVACVEEDDSDGDQCTEIMRQSACILLGKSDYNRYVIGRNKHRACKVGASPPDQSTQSGKRGRQTRPKSARVINRRGLSGFARDMLVQLNVPEDVIRGCYVEKTKNQRWGPECLLTHLLLQYKKSVSEGTAIVPPPCARKPAGGKKGPPVSTGPYPHGEPAESAPTAVEENAEGDSELDFESGDESETDSSNARFAAELERNLVMGINDPEPEVEKEVTSNYLDMPDLSNMYDLMGEVGAQLDSVAEPSKSK